MEVTGPSAVGYGTSAIAEGIFHMDSPLSKQPLRDVDPIAVAFAPAPQLDRGNVLVLTQSQLANLLIELSRQDRNWPNRIAPIWISPMSHISPEKTQSPCFEITGPH
jgi:hypothetical protein